MRIKTVCDGMGNSGGGQAPLIGSRVKGSGGDFHLMFSYWPTLTFIEIIFSCFELQIHGCLI